MIWEWYIPEPVTAVDFTPDDIVTLEPLPVTRVTVEHKYIPFDSKQPSLDEHGFIIDDVHAFTIDWQGTNNSGHHTRALSEEARRKLSASRELWIVPLVSDEIRSERENQYRYEMDRWVAEAKSSRLLPPIPSCEYDDPAIVIALENEFCIYFRAHPDSKPVKVKRML